MDDRSHQTEAEPLEPYAWEGDDDHVIFWMLSLTPTQRVEAAQNFVKGVLMLDPAEDDSLTDELLASNPKFQQLVAKSKASPRKPFRTAGGRNNPAG